MRLILPRAMDVFDFDTGYYTRAEAGTYDVVERRVTVSAPHGQASFVALVFAGTGRGLDRELWLWHAASAFPEFRVQVEK